MIVAVMVTVTVLTGKERRVLRIEALALAAGQVAVLLVVIVIVGQTGVTV